MIGRRLLPALGAGLVAAPARAQGWRPDRPVRITVPFPPGALTDVLGRMAGEWLQERLGQPAVVENRPGAGTLLGAAFVARQPADGHSLLVATVSTLAISPAMQAEPAARYTDFTPVALLGDVRFYLVCNNDLPVRDLAGLVALLRAEPGRHPYASPGNGSVHHLLTELMLRRERLEAQHVPYQGSVTALNDLAAGRVAFMFLDAAVAVPQVEAGRVRGLAVNGPNRRAAAPALPSIAERWPALTMTAWQSISAPAGLPRPIAERLNAALNEALSTPATAARLDRVGVEPRPMPLDALPPFVAAEAERWAQAVREAGLAGRG